MTSYVNSQWRTARTRHVCEICGHDIPRGCRYLSSSGVFDGSWWSSKAHQDCAEMHWHHNEGRGEDDQVDDYYLDQYRGLWPHAVCRIELRRQLREARA